MLEQWQIASLAVACAVGFWAGYWARGKEAPVEQRDDTEQRVGWPL